MSELVDMNLPKNGAAANKLIAIPRSFAGNISAITPPALVNGDEPNEPAKKRRIIRVQIFCDPAAPELNAVRAQYVMMKRICRPNSSLSGAQRRGPILVSHHPL